MLRALSFSFFMIPMAFGTLGGCQLNPDAPYGRACEPGGSDCPEAFNCDLNQKICVPAEWSYDPRDAGSPRDGGPVDGGPAPDAGEPADAGMQAEAGPDGVDASVPPSDGGPSDGGGDKDGGMQGGG